ncbi:MAG: hypothetical protein H7A25_08225 [Leptospiraceae bacterium]|nr:hypothetical protein [Leptospiraceae bacterium]
MNFEFHTDTYPSLESHDSNGRLHKQETYPSGKGIEKTEVGEVVNEHGDTESPTFSFSNRSRKLFFVTDFLEPPGKIKYHTVFVALDTEKWIDKEIFRLENQEMIEDSNRITTQLQNSSDWPSGLYRYDIYLEGNLAQSTEFSFSKET